MAILGFDYEEIARALELLETSGLEEIVWEEEERFLRVRAPRAPIAAPVSPAPAPPVARAEAAPRNAPRPKAIIAAPAVLPDSLPEDQFALTSPMVGIFYRSGKPEDPPFVEVGQRISKDQTVGIIEAMKIFSEIPAEQSGIVVAIPAVDGQLVQAGTPLFILKKES